MEKSPSDRLEELIRERARLDVELERCKELVTVLFVDIAGSARFYDEHGDVAGLVMVQKCLDLLIPTVEAHEGVGSRGLHRRDLCFNFLWYVGHKSVTPIYPSVT